MEAKREHRRARQRRVPVLAVRGRDVHDGRLQPRTRARRGAEARRREAHDAAAAARADGVLAAHDRERGARQDDVAHVVVGGRAVAVPQLHRQDPVRGRLAHEQVDGAVPHGVRRVLERPRPLLAAREHHPHVRVDRARHVHLRQGPPVVHLHLVHVRTELHGDEKKKKKVSQSFRRGNTRKRNTGARKRNCGWAVCFSCGCWDRLGDSYGGDKHPEGRGDPLKRVWERRGS